MGCDIHMYLEYKIDDGCWTPHKGHVAQTENEGTEDEYLFVAEISATGRDYNLFETLANVRGSSGPEPKGIPDDISKTINLAIEQWDIDGHSHSYCDYEEFKEILKDVGYIDPTDRVDMFYDFSKIKWQDRPPNYTTIIAACEKEKQELQIDAILLDIEPSKIDYRLIFFFDN